MDNTDKKLKRDQELKDLVDVMSTPAGRRFVWRFLSDGYIFRPCFTGTSHTYFNEGRREFALRYFNDVMKACPKLYHQMVEENNEEGDQTHG